MRSIIAPLRSKLNPLRLAVVRQYLMYGMITLITFAAVAMLDRSLTELPAIWHLLVLTLLAAGLGGLNLWLLLTRLLTEKSTAAKTWILIVSNLAGIGVFALISPSVSWQAADPLYVRVLLPALLFFLFPWSFYQALRYWLAIPPLWYQPVEVQSLKDIVAEIRFAENQQRGIKWVLEDDFYELDTSGVYVQNTFTPEGVGEIELFRLFKGFLSLHNHSLQPQNSVDFKQAGWQFYHCPSRWRPGRKRAMNPSKTLRQNHLRFWKVSKKERARSKLDLSDGFEAATIYIRRTKKPEDHEINQ